MYFTGEQQSWAIPPPHIKLVQKIDPLARKPYKLFNLRQQVLTSNGSKNEINSNDKAKLTGEAINGHDYGTNIQTLETELSKKLSWRWMGFSLYKIKTNAIFRFVIYLWYVPAEQDGSEIKQCCI